MIRNYFIVKKLIHTQLILAKLNIYVYIYIYIYSLNDFNKTFSN